MKVWTVSLILASVLLLACALGQGGGPLHPGGGETQPFAVTLRRELLEKGERWQTVPVPASEAVLPDWFRDAVFVGDSITVALKRLSEESGVLGDPSFLCAVSLSQANALRYEAGNPNLPEWPGESGLRPALWDSTAETEATKIYLMLGMNCISFGVDKACRDLVTLIGKILERSPGAAILVQSVTPMRADSPRADEALNNETIRQFNQTAEALCREHGWYYIDVGEALSDETGALRPSFSEDTAMGIHLNSAGAAAWADYLLTHVPAALKKPIN